MASCGAPCARSSAAILTAAALLGGCGSDDQPDRGPGVDAGAAVVRAELTGLLVDHAHAVGLAVLQGVRLGPDDPSAVAAARAADDTAAAFGGRVGEATGDGIAVSARLTDALRGHTNALRADALAASRGAGRQAARVRRTRRALSVALSRVADGLTPAAVSRAFVPAGGLGGSAVSGSPAYARRVADIAERMPDLAAGVARGIDDGDRLSGDPGAGAAQLRAELTGVLADATARTTLAAVLARADGRDAPRARTAAAAVDDTAGRLSETIASVYGEEPGAVVRGRVRELQTRLAAYAAAKAARIEDDAEVALAALDRGAEGLAGALSGAVPTLPAGRARTELAAHVDALAGALRAAAARSPRLPARVRTAVGRSGALARTLADAIQRDEPARFPPG